MVRVNQFLETLLLKVDSAEFSKLRKMIEEEACKDTEKQTGKSYKRKQIDFDQLQIDAFKLLRIVLELYR